MSNVETNAKIGRMFYQMMTDAAGYPNGMPYWPELPPEDKYFYAMNGISFLRDVEAAGMFTSNVPYGIGNSTWGEGECRKLVEYYESHQNEEMAELERRIAMLKKNYGPEQDP